MDTASQRQPRHREQTLRRLALVLALGGLAISVFFALRDQGGAGAERVARLFQAAVWAGAAEDAAALLAEDPGVAFRSWTADCARRDPPALQTVAVVLDGDRAEVTLAGDGELTSTLVDLDGAWRVSGWSPARPCGP